MVTTATDFDAEPDKDILDSDENSVDIVLLSDLDEDNMNDLFGETIGYAIIDSGCTRTVCGNRWLDTYLDTLSVSDRRTVTSKSSSFRFRFGDGKTYVSNRTVNIPVHFGSVSARLDTSIVECNVPLLMSRISLKRAEASLDFSNDEITILGEDVPITISKSGHYCVSLSRSLNCNSRDIQRILFTAPLEPGNTEDNKRKVLKLHKQFAHPPAERLKKLISDSGVNDSDINQLVDHVSSHCDICRQFKRPPLKPAVAFPSASAFNDTVAMDLKFMGNGIYLLHMIDHATRYSSACVIRNKRKETIVISVLENWIRIFGSPHYFLTDNGGEFVNDLMLEYAEKFNISLKTTAAESAWSNGLCERHNGILADLIHKTMKDANCSLEMAVHWAVAAKNALMNVYGYCPNQLVFGRNINLPSVHVNKPPAQNNTSTSEYITNNLLALHKSRQAFIQQESCERLRRALTRKTRTYSDIVYNNGDTVYYRRNNAIQWHGPAKVLGRDGQQYLLKHGGIYIRVHPCRMQHVTSCPESESSTSSESPAQTPPLRHDSNAGSPHAVTGADVSDDSDDEEPTHQIIPLSPPPTPAAPLAPPFPPLELPRQPLPYEPLPHSPPPPSDALPGRLPRALQRLQDYNRPPLQHTDINCPEEQTQSEHLTSDGSDDIDPESTEELYFGITTDSARFDYAKAQEIQKWRDLDAFTEVDDVGQPTISCRWVCTERVKGGKLTLKARLVARGFEENTSQMKTDSPTCHKESLRLLLCTLSAKSWTLHTLDIKSAYLQGTPIERELYLKPPPCALTSRLWKLKKCPYGLADAGRHWYLRVVQELKSLGARQCRFDQAIFVWTAPDEPNILAGIVAVHVDDFLYGGTPLFHTMVISRIRKTFIIGLEECSGMKYLGLSIQETDTGILLSTSDYSRDCQEMNTINLGPNRDRSLTPEEVTSLKQLSGQLNWVSTQSRPDLAFENCSVANSIKNAVVRDVFMANKSIRQLKGQDVTLRFLRHFKLTSCRIVAFCDASFGNLPDRGSQGGHLIFLVDSAGAYCLIAWQSRRIRRVVNSTIAAECLAAVEAAETSVFLATALREILDPISQNGITVPISVLCDNRSLVDAVHSSTSVENKRLQIDISVLRDMIQRKELQEFRWVPTDMQVANALTKKGCSTMNLLDILCCRRRFEASNGSFV